MPFIAQADAIRAEFMAKNPDWVFKPKPIERNRRKRRTPKRTLADEQRYMRIALGFNSGKRGKELKRLAEMTGIEEVSTSLSNVRRSRKSITKKAATTTKAVISTDSVERTSQSVIYHTQSSESADLPLALTKPIYLEEAPLSPQRLSLRHELQPDQENFSSSPSIAYQPHELPDASSILMAQDSYPQGPVTEEPAINSLMSQLNELAVDSTVTGLFDDWWYQQQFSSVTPTLDDIMHEFSSGFPPY